MKLILVMYFTLPNIPEIFQNLKLLVRYFTGGQKALKSGCMLCPIAVGAGGASAVQQAYVASY